MISANFKLGPSKLESELQIGNDEELNTPLHRAIIKKDKNFGILLIEKFPEQGSAVNMFGETPLHLLAKCEDDTITLAEALVCAGVNINERDRRGQTPIYTAAKSDNVEFIKLLFEISKHQKKSIDPTQADKFGNTPLHVAVSNNNIEIARILLTNGAEVNFVNLAGRTALHIMVEKGSSVQFAGILIDEFKANVNAQDKQGLTALHLAIFHSRPLQATEITRRGASIHLKSIDGKTCLNEPPSGTPNWLQAQQAIIAALSRLEWVPDEISDSCQICDFKFSAHHRRHHCRHCGRLVCGACSREKMPLIKFNIRSNVRVCFMCKSVLSK
eukprot:TRINITY_DN7438_c1_g1_i1.p1 TRINITY_DN7438_c1_g1~~TRINITY_DN7438_c1_g1_i1.p1  ORF type:complete len:329 (+),score=136.01 TRINITY_DN7438_c1_g1_i1:161-1147(+)